MCWWSLSTAKYANTFYITPNVSITSCPGNPCHVLTYYLQNSSQYFQSDTQFIFLPGIHQFDTGIQLEITEKENIRFVGSNNLTQHSVAEKVMEYGFDPYHEDERITFLQSPSIILCSKVSGFSFVSMVNLSLVNISLLNCGNGSPAGIYMSNVFNLLMDGVSIQNSTGYGFFGSNLLGQSTIVRSSFIANNQYVKDMLLKTNVGSLQCNGVVYDHNTAYVNDGPVNCAALKGGNMVIHYNDIAQETNQLCFSNLVFSLGVDGTFGSQCDDYTDRYPGTGLSITLEQTTFTVIFDIQDSTFYRHQAHEGASIDILFNTLTNNKVILTNVSIIRGLAYSGGAGMDVNIYEQSSTVSMINATGLIFECNHCQETKSPEPGVALNTRFDNYDGDIVNSHSLILLHSCIFQDSKGYSSLGIVFAATIPKNLPNSSVQVFDSTFLDAYPFNTRFSVSAYKVFGDATNPSVSMHNSTVLNSNFWFECVDLIFGDVIFFGSKLWAMNNSTILFHGNITFEGRSSVENGGALYLSSSSAVIAQNSNVMFINNTALYGGAMFIDSQSTLLFISPCNVSFISNTALLYGGGLYVKRKMQTLHYSQLQPCFFKVNATSSHYSSVHMYFEGNFAGEAGSVLYGGDIDDCSLNNAIIPYDITSGELFNDISEFGPNDNSSALISSDPESVCLCNHTCSSTAGTATGYPGQSVNISFLTMGQRNSTTPAVVIVHTIIPSEKIIEVLYTSKQCYHYSTKIGSTRKTIKFTTELALSENLPNRNEAMITINIKLPCPEGFDLNTSIPSCVCSSLLQGYGFKCSIQEEILLKPGNEWIGFAPDNAIGLVTQCPFDYCYDSRVVDVRMGYGFDSQCKYNRSKVLCGQCKGNLSMIFGTSQCAECSNYYLFLMVPFAILGVALVALLFILNVTVISGTLNGIIFYANVFRVNDNIFIPVIKRTGISQASVIIIAWLNLDFGIETCFYNGMGSVAKTWLQFVFPFYLLSLVRQ